MEVTIAAIPVTVICRYGHPWEARLTRAQDVFHGVTATMRRVDPGRCPRCGNRWDKVINEE